MASGETAKVKRDHPAYAQLSRVNGEVEQMNVDMVRRQLLALGLSDK